MRLFYALKIFDNMKVATNKTYLSSDSNDLLMASIIPFLNNNYNSSSFSPICKKYNGPKCHECNYSNGMQFRKTIRESINPPSSRTT